MDIVKKGVNGMILTVVQGRQGTEWLDLEVPDESTIQYVKSVLAVRIFNEPPQDHVQYIVEAKFPGSHWFVLPDTKLLSETGLREGSYVRLQKTFSTTDKEAPVIGKRLLFQTGSHT
ncbi:MULTISPECIES: hypothetical protein [Paenibacillus]